jgi:hypothetical protein
MNVAGKRNLLGKREHEFDGTPGFETCFNDKIESAEADVSRFSRLLENAIFLRIPHFQRKHHRETARSAALNTFSHGPSGD